MDPKGNPDGVFEGRLVKGSSDGLADLSHGQYVVSEWKNCIHCYGHFMVAEWMSYIHCSEKSSSISRKKLS